MEQLSEYGQALLEAHKIALRTYKAHDFRVVDTRATLIRSEGQQGRLAAQQAKREVNGERAEIAVISNDERAAKTIRKITFGKKKEGLEPQTFQLKRIAKRGSSPVQTAQPENLQSPPSQLQKPQPEKQEPENPEKEVVAGELSSEAAELANPLSKEEMTLLLEMKPAGIGKEFGLARLRATADVLEIEYLESHSATALATAILNHVKKYRQK